MSPWLPSFLSLVSSLMKIVRYRPDLIDFTYVRNLKPEARMEYLFKVAERDLGVITLLDPEGMKYFLLLLRFKLFVYFYA